MNPTYTAPVNQLLTLGDAADRFDVWADYINLGLNQEHIPQLIQMLNDRTLHEAGLKQAERWAPIHAWRALAQLKAVDALPSLIAHLRKIDEDHDDWIGEEFPEVFNEIGPASIEPLSQCLADKQYREYARACAAESIASIGDTYTDTRDRCINVLTKTLDRCIENDPFINAEIICGLIDLEAVESIEAIRSAFEEDCVDISIVGDLEDVEIDLGLRSERTTPKKKVPLFTGSMKGIQKDARQKSAKIGRNDPCPCGSGKKYKRCCLR